MKRLMFCGLSVFVCLFGVLQPSSQTDSGSILIHNKDHNKCVNVVNANVVQAEACDVSSDAQRFRWVSSSRIISVSLKLCLGAQDIKNWVKIILLPCKENSPLQTWECKKETLFGLKDQPLHLNYGNREEPNMMLYNGTGVWSRWQIYGSEDNLCSHGYQDSGSFLINNKDHNKCVNVVNANVVQAEACDVSSDAQRFRWVSSSRIISVSLKLCLGAQDIKNWVKIILLPCKEHSPLQTWECKKETLFGLKDQQLHLNYGNREEPNMMLYNGTGVWSRWQIYGSEDNLCSHAYQDIFTLGGNSFGKPCQFPFKFKDKWHDECIAEGRSDGRLWCSAETDYDKEKKWGFCSFYVCLK